jgi:phosphinothricin acetyltransferase
MQRPLLHYRLAVEADLATIVRIYNESIPGGWSTADTRPITVESRIAWFRQFNAERRPLWIAEIDGVPVAWASVSSFYAGRPAYDATAEISLYVGIDYQKRGIGRAFKRFVIEQCPRLGITTLLSMYFDHNAATRRLNEELGFETMGHLQEIAIVNGQPRGLIIAGLRIPAVSAAIPG